MTKAPTAVKTVLQTGIRPCFCSWPVSRGVALMLRRLEPAA